MASGKIFINYRRDDSRADSGRLYDRLNARYPNRVFRDVGSLEPGIEWHEAIEKVLGSSDAVVVVIGKNWLTVTNSAGARRLDDPKDTVRQEILTALRRGVRVFPVLVGGAHMPSEEELPADLQSLARRNALEITEQDWDEGFEKLAEALDHALGVRGKTPKQPRRFRPGVAIAALLGVAIIAVVVVTTYHSTQNSPAPVVREDAGSQKNVESNAPNKARKTGAGAESNAGIRS
ncbi:MAG TPA: toll/interleukin-1 receptor domain-containing protein, partial [Terriglobia bacterium]|nr:toll/interleukin-1 receptor domain-containing protein [Terriglobia bacterium]